MGARGRRGLLAGLESLAGSTGRIADRNAARALLALKHAESQRQEKELQAALDEVERERKLSEFLAGRQKEGRARFTQGLVHSGRLSEALGPAYMQGLESDIPAGALSELLTRLPSESTAASDALERDLAASRISLSEYRKRRLEGLPDQAPRPRYLTREEILAGESETQAAKQDLTDQEMLRMFSNAPAVEEVQSPRLTPGLSAVLEGVGPAREQAAQRIAGERLRGGMAAAGAPATRIGIVEPTLTSQDAIKRADRFGASIVNLVLPPLGAKDRNAAKRTQERIDLALAIKSSPAYQKLISLPAQEFDAEAQQIAIQGIKYFVPDYQPKVGFFEGLGSWFGIGGP